MTWLRMQSDYTNPPTLLTNAHYVPVLTENYNSTILTGESLCQLPIVMPVENPRTSAWVVAKSPSHKCPICALRRSESSTASVPPASSKPSGPATITRRSARAATRRLALTK